MMCVSERKFLFIIKIILSTLPSKNYQHFFRFVIRRRRRRCLAAITSELVFLVIVVNMRTWPNPLPSTSLPTLLSWLNTKYIFTHVLIHYCVSVIDQEHFYLYILYYKCISIYLRVLLVIHSWYINVGNYYQFNYVFNPFHS